MYVYVCVCIPESFQKLGLFEQLGLGLTEGSGVIIVCLSGL